jgi:hypothetical protein
MICLNFFYAIGMPAYSHDLYDASMVVSCLYFFITTFIKSSGRTIQGSKPHVVDEENVSCLTRPDKLSSLSQH